jgi:hypothetical protein
MNENQQPTQSPWRFWQRLWSNAVDEFYGMLILRFIFWHRKHPPAAKGEFYEPFGSLLGGDLFWAMGAGAWPAAALLWAGGAAASVIARRGSRHAPAYGLLYPLDALLTSLCLVLGLRDAARGSLAAWKGRAVKLQ